MKPTYTFSDLLEWLANEGVGLRKMETNAESDMGENKKGKGKEKAKEKRKGKGKESKKNGQGQRENT